MLKSECPVWLRWVFKMRIWAKTLIGWFWKSSLIGWQRHRVNFENSYEFNGEHYIFGGDVGDPDTGDAAGWIYQMAKIDGCGLKKMPDLPFSFTQASFSSLKNTVLTKPPFLFIRPSSLAPKTVHSCLWQSTLMPVIAQFRPINSTQERPLWADCSLSLDRPLYSLRIVHVRPDS